MEYTESEDVEEDSGVRKRRILRILDILDTNCIEVKSGAVKAIYPTVSLMSHSCISNVRQVFQAEYPFKAECR